MDDDGGTFLISEPPNPEATDSTIYYTGAAPSSAPNHHGVVVKQPVEITCKDELLSLLKWSMLAACTIGPGTVVVCSKSGADYQLQLQWTLVAASFVAFVLQKEAARLTMVSGKSFGRAIRERFGDSTDKVPKIGYFVAIGVFIGNTALEANCFAGAEGGLFVLYKDVWWFRILMALVLAVATLLALLYADVDKIGQMLGIIVAGMTIIFAVTASKVPPIYEAANNTHGVHPDATERDFTDDLLAGIFVPNIPEGASVTVLSMIATTAIPFNTFLAASMTEMAATPGQMKRGVGFATFLAMVISMLVVVIGSGINVEEGHDFQIGDLGELIGTTLGKPAKVLFCLGLYAAAYSSAITVPLGTALTCQQIFYEGRKGTKSEHASKIAEAARAAAEDGPEATIHTQPPATVVNAAAAADAAGPADEGEAGVGGGSSKGETAASPLGSGKALTGILLVGGGELGEGTGTDGDEDDSALLDESCPGGQTSLLDYYFSGPDSGPLEKWNTGGAYFKANMFAPVVVAVLTSSAGLPTVAVIFTAQVINGLLLPCLAVCLFICLNDPILMPNPSSALDNIAMLICVFVTMFLAFHLVLDELSGITGTDKKAWDSNTSIGVAMATGAAATVYLAAITLPCAGVRRTLGLANSRASLRQGARPLEMDPL